MKYPLWRHLPEFHQLQLRSKGGKSPPTSIHIPIPIHFWLFQHHQNFCQTTKRWRAKKLGRWGWQGKMASITPISSQLPIWKAESFHPAPSHPVPTTHRPALSHNKLREHFPNIEQADRGYVVICIRIYIHPRLSGFCVRRGRPTCAKISEEKERMATMGRMGTTETRPTNIFVFLNRKRVYPSASFLGLGQNYL